MNISTLVGLALLLSALGVVCGKSSHSRDYSLEDTDDSNRMIVKSSFRMSLPLFLRNAIDLFTSTQATPMTTTTHRPCETLTCQNGGTLRAGIHGSCPTCECKTGCYGEKCETCIPNPTTTVPSNSNCSSFVCLNGGTLIHDDSGCRCNCLNDFQGDTCATTSTSHRPTTTSLAPITTTSSKLDSSFIDIGTWIGRVAILKNQNYVATGYDSKSGLRIYDLRNKQLVRTLNSSSPWISSLKSFKENQLIQGSIGHINIWNVETGELVRTLDTPYPDLDWSMQIGLNKNQSLMLTNDEVSNIILWDLVEYKQIRIFSGHTSRVSSVLFNEVSNQIISGSYDQTIKLWNMNNGSLIRTLTGLSSISKLLLDEETGLLYSLSYYDNTIKEWNIENGTVLRTFTGHTDQVVDFIWSEDGQRLISSSYDKTIIIRNKWSGEIINRLNHTYGTFRLALNPLNGQLLSTATWNDTRLIFWPLRP